MSNRHDRVVTAGSAASSLRPAAGRRAAVVAGLRTPFVRAWTDFVQLEVLDLARAVTVELLQRSGLRPDDVDHVIYGNVTRPVQYSNLARELVLAAGLPKRTPANTVSLACASAAQAITDAANLIERGYADVVVAGGAEMLSKLALERAGLQLSDIGVVEMHEAFAAQVLSTLQKLDSKAFASAELGRAEAVGRVDPERINVRGGSIALGHPFGATAARCVTTLANEMERRSAQFGLVSVCAAGGVGVAIVLERA